MSSQSKPNFLVKYCNYKAAKFACETWHYSKCLPIGKLVKIGLWEEEVFKGVVIFSYGTAKDLGTRYGYKIGEAVELTRVAFSNHVTPCSQVLKIALKMLKKENPKIELVVSFSDADQDHDGGIYRAGNWIYAGTTLQNKKAIYKGKELSDRTYGEMLLKDRSFRSKCEWLPRKPKHRFLMPLTKEAKERVAKFKVPFKKLCDISKDSVAGPFQGPEGGAIPTMSLQNK